MYQDRDRKVRVGNIAGLAEVCEAIGYSDGYVSMLLRDRSTGFPLPLTSIRAGRLWDIDEVRRWRETWRHRDMRKPGRPPKEPRVRPEPVPRRSAEDRAKTLDALLGRL